MKTMWKAVAVGAALALAAPVAWAEDVTFMARPSASTLPLFVLQAKAGDFLPEGTNVVLKAVPPGKAGVVGALKNREVDYVTMFHGMGASLFSEGMTHLQLAGIHAWGAAAILSRADIEPGDWAAMKGATLLAVPGLKTPPHRISMLAMKVNGVNAKQEVMMSGATVHEAFEQMASPDNAPDFVIIAEPQLSHGLIKMAQGEWPTQYHVFADSAQSISAFGVPLAGLWIVGEQENAREIVAGFNLAVDYMMDPANRQEVAQIIADGFNTTFGKSPPTQVFTDVLERGLLNMNFKSGAAMEARLHMGWARAGLSPDRDIIWRGNDFKVPGQAFLVSQMLPRHVGIVLAHGDELDLTPKTRMATLRIRAWAHDMMVLQRDKTSEAEAEILAAYLANDWDAVDAGLVRMAEIRLESSRIQVECIKRTQAEFDPADIEKIRIFMQENADLVAEFGGL